MKNGDMRDVQDTYRNETGEFVRLTYRNEAGRSMVYAGYCDRYPYAPPAGFAFVRDAREHWARLVAQLKSEGYNRAEREEPARVGCKTGGTYSSSNGYRARMCVGRYR